PPGLLGREPLGPRVDCRLRAGDGLRVRGVHVRAEPRGRLAVLEPRVDHDLLARVLADPGAVRAEDARLGHRRKSLPDPEVEMVERSRAQTDEDLPGPRLGIGRVLVAENLRPAVLMDPDRLHAAQSPTCGRLSCAGMPRSSASTRSGRLRPRPTRRPRGASTSGGGGGAAAPWA